MLLCAELRIVPELAGFKTMFLAGFYPADYRHYLAGKENSALYGRKELLERIADSAQINHDYIVLMSLSNGRLRDVKIRSIWPRLKKISFSGKLADRPWFTDSGRRLRLSSPAGD